MLTYWPISLESAFRQVQNITGTLEQADNEARNIMILNDFLCLWYFRTPSNALEQTLENGGF